MPARLRDRRVLAIVVIAVAVALAVLAVATGESGAALFAVLLAAPPALFLFGEARERP